MDKLLSGKSILITGGSGQLGRVFVRQALTAGARVFFTFMRHHEEAQALIRLGAEGSVLDLSETCAIDRFCENFGKRLEQLDVLIHNAAATRDGTIQQLSEEDWDYILTVNLKAPYYLTQKLLPLLLRPKNKNPEAEKNRSKVFMIISRLALHGAYGASNYAAAKGGLIGLAKSMALELGRRQVLVNAINPGFMQSPMTQELPEILIQRNLEASPIKDFSHPEEVAKFLVYLCSDHMTQMTGQVIHFESRFS